MSNENNTSIRYVAAGNPTGWAAMAKTIREVDEDKIQNHKEDIDTLLVFTGLFSAVLTAFVIVSYAGLSPDKQDTVIQLLGQIANQSNSYIVTSSTINSTVAPLSQLSMVFEPTLAILGVNYLWFASLIITLVTASFSMLVKQWLREYLAYDYTSPRERLRARQFRHPGLVTWKVYEIAGVLPLLLQLALGLFFLGLCFFTWSEEHGIGTMCLVLVGLWAFSFISVSIAPITSSRCPYKTPLLKSIIASIRRRFRRLLSVSSASAAIQASTTAMSLGMIQDHTLQLRLAKYLLEEEDAIKRDTDEVAVLREVDSFLLDDDLLGTTILDSLTQNYTSPPDVIKFVLQALAVRVKGDTLTQPLTSPPDLRQLTKGAWIAISNLVASAVLSGVRTGVKAVEPWVQDAIYLLFAVSDQPLTLRARNAVVRCIQKSTLPHVRLAFGLLASLPTPASRFQAILDPGYKRLYTLLTQRQIQPEDIIAFIIDYFAMEMRRAPSILPLSSFIDLQPLSDLTWKCSMNIISATLQDALGPSHDKDSVIGPWFEDALYLLLSHPSRQPTTPSIKALAGLCSSDMHRTRFVGWLRPLASPNSEYFAQILPRW